MFSTQQNSLANTFAGITGVFDKGASTSSKANATSTMTSTPVQTIQDTKEANAILQDQQSTALDFSGSTDRSTTGVDFPDTDTTITTSRTTQNSAVQNTRSTPQTTQSDDTNYFDEVDEEETDTDTVTKTAADYTGAGQVIVIIDTGFSYYYDQSSVVYFYDFSGSNDSDASVDSSYSHGSWVADVATQTASDVSIIHLKISDDDGDNISVSDLEEALDYTLYLSDYYDIAAVNISLSSGNTTSDVYTVLSDEFAALDSADILVSVAAGNSGETYDDGINVIAANDSVVAVSASDDDGAETSWTQSSETLTDIFADGTEWEIEALDGTTYTVSGTSFSAPTIAATAALLQEASEDINGDTLSDEEILFILQESGDAVTGYDDSDADGYVVADAEAALTYFIENSDSFVDDFLFA